MIGDNDREILIGDRRLAGGAGGSGVGRGSLWSYKFTSKLWRFFVHRRLTQVLPQARIEWTRTSYEDGLFAVNFSFK